MEEMRELQHPVPEPILAVAEDVETPPLDGGDQTVGVAAVSTEIAIDPISAAENERAADPYRAMIFDGVGRALEGLHSGSTIRVGTLLQSIFPERRIERDEFRRVTKILKKDPRLEYLDQGHFLIKGSGRRTRQPKPTQDHRHHTDTPKDERPREARRQIPVLTEAPLTSEVTLEADSFETMMRAWRHSVNQDGISRKRPNIGRRGVGTKKLRDASIQPEDSEDEDLAY